MDANAAAAADTPDRADDTLSPRAVFRRRIRQYDAVFPDLRETLYLNPGLTLDMILDDVARHPDKKHLWESPPWLTKTIRPEAFVAHFALPPFLFAKPHAIENLTLAFVLRHRDAPWDWTRLSDHPNIPVDDILAHPELPWAWTWVSMHAGLAFRHLHDAPHRHLPWNRRFAHLLVLSPKATYAQIMAAPDEAWGAACLSSPAISKEEAFALVPFFQAKALKAKVHENSPWLSGDPELWFSLCKNPNLAVPDLVAFWERTRWISRSEAFAWMENPNTTVADLRAFPRDRWPTRYLSRVLPIEFIVANKPRTDWFGRLFSSSPRYAWDWDNVLSRNKGATYALLAHVPSSDKYDRLRERLFSNPHLSRRDRERVMHDLLAMRRPYYANVVAAPIFLQPTLEEIRRHLAKRRIVRHAVRALSDPQFAQCRKRLRRELDALRDE
jgi:hypothetical protein